MKRNIVPLLGIAFVVAIAATGVFYGLFVGKISGATQAGAEPAGRAYVVLTRPVDRGAILTAADVRLDSASVKHPDSAYTALEDVIGKTVAVPLAAKEPLTPSGLAGARGAGRLAIPKGMRAISIRVADSSGLLPFVRSGQRIDVQAIIGQNSAEPSARTLLSNVEVLNVHTDTSASPQAQSTVLNLLVPTRDVERVALADSAAKVRIVLRSTEDNDDAPALPKSSAAARLSAPANAGPRVTFEVKTAAAPPALVRQLSAQAEAAQPGDYPFQIGILPKAWQADPGLKILSTDSLNSPASQEVSFQAGKERDRDYDLRLRLMARGISGGTLRLRVRPELTLPQRGGFSSRRFSADLDVSEGRSVLMAGFERDASAPALMEKLFQSANLNVSGRELLIVVTPRLMAAAPVSGK